MEIYRKDLEDFDGFIVGKTLLDVTSEDIAKFIEVLKLTYSERSIYRKLTPLKGFYKYLLKTRNIDKFPMFDIESPKKVKKETLPLEKWEITNILEVCEDTYVGRRDSIIIRLLYETGLKIGDILELEKEGLEKAKYHFLTVISNSKVSTCSLSDKLSEDLKNFVRNDLDNMYINRNKIFSELSRQNFRRRFINYGKKANLKRDISPSMIKKTVINETLKDVEGVSLLDKIREAYMKTKIGDEE